MLPHTRQTPRSALRAAEREAAGSGTGFESQAADLKRIWSSPKGCLSRHDSRAAGSEELAPEGRAPRCALGRRTGPASSRFVAIRCGGSQKVSRRESDNLTAQ